MADPHKLEALQEASWLDYSTNSCCNKKWRSQYFTYKHSDDSEDDRPFDDSVAHEEFTLKTDTNILLTRNAIILPKWEL